MPKQAQEEKHRPSPQHARDSEAKQVSPRQVPLAPRLQRVLIEPKRSAYTAHDDVLILQRTVGNRATTRYIQAKLRVGPTGDRYEREADRVAQQVLAMPDATTVTGTNALTAQRQEEEIQAKPLVNTITPLLQRQEEEDELQMKSVAGGGFAPSSDLEARLADQQGRGTPLSDATRTFMEPRFSANFSGVRVHTGSEAAQISQQINAKAFTHGQDIYFGAGAYNPKTKQGKELLAHELTHTIQQGDARHRISRWGGLGNTTSHEEVTAEAFKGIGGYSKQAREYLESMSEQMDMRVSFWATVAAGKSYGALLTKFGTGMAFNGKAYDNLKGYWRKKSEAPNHGEAGMYKGDGASTDIARVNFLVDRAIDQWKGDNPRTALTTLGLALHSAEDRGAHGDGRPGTGHDPRRIIKPPVGAQKTQYYRPGWKGTDCDLKTKNPQGYKFGVKQAKFVLTKFKSALDRWEQPELGSFKKPGKFKRGMRKLGLFFGRGIKKGTKEEKASPTKKTPVGGQSHFSSEEGLQELKQKQREKGLIDLEGII